MKKYIMLILASVVVFNVFSQEENAVDGKLTRKLTKQQKLEQKQAQEEATAKLVKWMVEQRRFVIEANYLSDQSGERIVVNSNLNFLAIDSSKITIQIASPTSMGGSNGLGGITTEGSILQFEVKNFGKTQNNYSIRLFTQTPLGAYDIFLTIYSNGNVDATLSGNTRGRLNYHGVMVPIEQSRVFKGMSF
jgi:hypothetical protein